MKKFAVVILLLARLPALAQVNLNLGLRAYYPFNGNANDVSGNNNNPVFNNATLTTDRFGNPNSAYHFNGTSNYMQIANSATINTTNQISLCAWIKPMGFYSGACHGNSIMCKADGDGFPGEYFLRYDDNYYVSGNNCSNPAPDITHENFYGSNPAIPTPGYTPYIQTNQWYSVVYTYDGTTAKVYINCQLKISANISISSFTNSYDLFIGKLNNGSFPYWINGDMDEIRIYDRALNQDEVNVLGGCPSANPCQTWAALPSQPAYVDIGDLDISGAQLTVEATGNRTSFLSNGVITDGDLVSKHTGANDANYTLRPTYAFITTTNGFYSTPAACPISLNKTYHYAMVYDGTTLKFYRDGFLMGQTPATGNLVQNNLNTTIGWIPSHNLNENFVGYINEVRIWNVARTQAQIQANMNTSLPNPTTQPGLKAYYVFDDPANKQGNSAWNGTLGGGASINATNPNCSFVADTCVSFPPIGGIINDYTPVTAFDICVNKLTVVDATKFNTGDTVLLIQMKGAVIDSSNTAAFGTVTNYNNSGNYEFNYVKGKVGNVIELKNKLTRQYDIPNGKVQLVRVPYYNSVSVTSPLTCPAWDGSKGGVLVLNVKDTAEMNADINTSGRGFLKGIMHNANVNTATCDGTDYYFPDNTIHSAGKGEGITFLSTNRNSGKGPAANGGGGGMDSNSGGGGGSNGSKGGRGGYEWNNCPNYLTISNWGYPGNSPAYSTASNKIFMGGGGGAGHCNNLYFDPTYPDADYNGGNGGGLIIINANYIKNNSYKIISKGDSAYQPVDNGTYVTHDGMGGGGAGGTVLLNTNNYINNLNVDVTGGTGANMVSNVAPGYVGPGGGGGGGVVWVKQNSLPPAVIVTNTGGSNGVVVQNSNNPYGAAPGLAGINVFSLSVPVDNTPFTKNIDSTRIKDSSTSCFAIDFKGLGYTNTNPISTWQWTFGDGGTASTQNTSHNYGTVGTFPVTLIVTDINGCKDTTTKNVTTTLFVADAGNDTSVCSAPAVSVTLHASAGAAYSWTPAAFLNNPNIQNPVATISATTRFYVTITSPSNVACKATDSVLITLNASLTPAIIITTASNNICTGTPVTFTAVATNGGSPPAFQWQKNGTNVGTNSNTYTDAALSNGDIIQCILTSNLSCASPSTAQSNSITMTVTSPPANLRYPTITGLVSQPLQLQARNLGGNSYNWLPATGLNNHLIINPIFSYNVSQEYKIYIATPAGCQVVDTQLVSLKGTKGIYVPKAFTPNNDGVNDRLYPILVGIQQLYYFRIYNRWGNLIFETNSGNPALGWDGSFKGKNQPVESYSWAAEGLDIDGFIIKKTGSTMLVR